MPFPALGRAPFAGRDAVVAAFRDSPAFREGRLSWAPVRGGVSADGTARLHLRLFEPDRRRSGAPESQISRLLDPPPRGLAGRRLPPAARARRARSRTALLPRLAPRLRRRARALSRRSTPPTSASLAAAEQAFSDRAQQVGLRAAFREYGRADAMNMYEGAAIRVGLDAITAGFPEGETTSPVSWSTERSFAASSGDLGVSIGIIRGNGPAPKASPSFPFFTIWRRDRPGRPLALRRGMSRPGARQPSRRPRPATHDTCPPTPDTRTDPQPGATSARRGTPAATAIHEALRVSPNPPKAQTTCLIRSYRYERQPVAQHLRSGLTRGEAIGRADHERAAADRDRARRP